MANQLWNKFKENLPISRTKLTSLLNEFFIQYSNVLHEDTECKIKICLDSIEREAKVSQDQIQELEQKVQRLYYQLSEHMQFTDITKIHLQSLNEKFDQLKNLDFLLDAQQLSLKKIYDSLNNSVAEIKLQIPLDRVLYMNFKEEKDTFIMRFIDDISKMDDFYQCYKNLIANLDDESIETIVRILQRVRLAASTDSDILNLYTLEEQEKIRTMWDHFDRNVIQISDSIYSYKRFFLPYNNFNPTVLYYNHGVDLISNKESVYTRNIIDAGAFIGDSALILSELTSQKVYSFEAITTNCDYMKKTIEMNNLQNVVIENAALSDSTGSITMYLSEVVDESSSIEIPNKTISKVEVPCITIDEYVEKHHLSVGLIKTDVEGAEQALLRGAINTIKNDRPVLILSIYHTADDFFSIKPLLEQLNLGYTFKIYRPPMMNVLTDTMLIAECK